MPTVLCRPTQHLSEGMHQTFSERICSCRAKPITDCCCRVALFVALVHEDDVVAEPRLDVRPHGLDLLSPNRI